MRHDTPCQARNWMSYLLDAQVNSGLMSTWEATEYLTANLIGEGPNTLLHNTKSPYEAIQQLLQRVYGPIVEAASRTVDLPQPAMIHMFTDISLMGNSAVLVVYFPGNNEPHQLLMLDGVRAWDLMFPTIDAFNDWAEERFTWVKAALATVSVHQPVDEPVELSMACTA